MAIYSAALLVDFISTKPDFGLEFDLRVSLVLKHSATLQDKSRSSRAAPAGSFWLQAARASTKCSQSEVSTW
jgi:hypothetical protein